MKTRLMLGLPLAAALAACAPMASGPARTVTMAPSGALASGSPSAIRGTSSLTPMSDGMTRVVVTLEGLAAGARHSGHIHTGSCAQQGPVAIPLPDVVAGANGTGRAEASVETAKIPASAYVNYHQRGAGEAGGIGGGVSCGDIK